MRSDITYTCCFDFTQKDKLINAKMRGNELINLKIKVDLIEAPHLVVESASEANPNERLA